MGIQENVKRQEAKLAAQVKMQAIQAEQPQTVTPEPTHLGVDVEALRESIRAELQASQPAPMRVDMDAIREVIRTELQAVFARQAMQTEQPAVDIEMLREVIRAELQAVPLVPAPVDMQAMQTMIRTEVCDIHTALHLLIEVIQQTQAVCDDDEQLPTAAPRSLNDEESRELKMFPAQESEEEEEPVMPPPARSESPIRRLRRPGPDIIALKNIPRVGLRRWEPLA